MIHDLRELLDAKPFRAFVIHLSDGQTFEVANPEQVKIPMRGTTIHFEARDGTTYVIAVDHIRALSFHRGAP